MIQTIFSSVLAEGKFYYAAGTDLVTVMATAPNEAILEAIDGANADHKLVAFDLMACLDDEWKVKRAWELANLGATLVSCHTGLSEQAVGKTPSVLIEKVCHQLKDTPTQVIAMGGLKPSSLKDLKPYIEQNKIFAIAVGAAITKSTKPDKMVTQFQLEINRLMADIKAESLRNKLKAQRLYSNAPWAAIDEFSDCKY